MRTLRDAFDEILKDPVKILRKALGNATKRQQTAVMMGFLRWKKGGIQENDRKMGLFKGIFVMRNVDKARNSEKRWAFDRIKEEFGPKKIVLSGKTEKTGYEIQEYTPLTVANLSVSPANLVSPTRHSDLQAISRAIVAPVLLKRVNPVEKWEFSADLGVKSGEIEGNLTLWRRNPGYFVIIFEKMRKNRVKNGWLVLKELIKTREFVYKPVVKPVQSVYTYSRSFSVQNPSISPVLSLFSSKIQSHSPSILSQTSLSPIGSLPPDLPRSSTQRRDRLIHYLQVYFLNGLRRHMHRWRVGIRSVEYTEEVIEVVETTHTTVMKVREDVVGEVMGSRRRTVLRGRKPRKTEVCWVERLQLSPKEVCFPMTLLQLQPSEKKSVAPRSNAKDLDFLSHSASDLDTPEKHLWKPSISATSSLFLTPTRGKKAVLGRILIRADKYWKERVRNAVEDWAFNVNLKRGKERKGNMPFSIVASPESVPSPERPSTPRFRFSRGEGRRSLTTLTSVFLASHLRPSFLALKSVLFTHPLPRTSISSTLSYPFRSLLIRHIYLPVFNRLKTISRRTPSISLSKESSFSILGSESQYEEFLQETVITEIQSTETHTKTHNLVTISKPIIQKVTKPSNLSDFPEMMEENVTVSRYNRQAINGLEMLFESLMVEKGFRPGWDALKMNSLEGSRSNSARHLQHLLLTLVSAYDFMPIFLLLKQIRKGRKQRKQKDLHPSIIRKQTNMRLIRLLNILKSAINRREKWALNRATGFLPKYKKRKYYNIQKSIKAIFQIVMLNTYGKTMELMKFLLYSRERPTASESLHLIPFNFYHEPKVRLIQRFIRGFLARRLRDRLLLAKRQNERLFRLLSVFLGHENAIRRLQVVFRRRYRLKKGVIGRKTVYKTSLKTHSSVQMRESVVKSQRKSPHVSSKKPGVTIIDPRTSRKEAVVRLGNAMKKWIQRIRKSRTTWVLTKLGCKKLRSKVVYSLQKGTKQLKDLLNRRFADAFSQLRS